MIDYSFRAWLESMQDLSDVIRQGFVLMDDASGLGGASDKYFLKSNKDGKTYLFKPGAKGDQDRPEQPHADVLGAKMSANLYDKEDDYVPVDFISPSDMQLIQPGNDKYAYNRFMQRYSGLGGSIQPMIQGAISKDYRGSGYKNLSPDDIRKLQMEQVVDWLISNHDSHGNQFIRAGIGGKLLGIDKSQALRHFGSDSLSHDYSPNSVYGEDDPIYNHIFRAAQSGELQIDPFVIKPLLDKVEKIPDDKYLEMFKPFLHILVGKPTAKYALKGLNRTAFNQEDVGGVLEMILDRKRSVKRAFSNYYSKMLGQNVSF